MIYLCILLLIVVFILISLNTTSSFEILTEKLELEEDAHKKITQVNVGTSDISVGIVCIGSAYGKDVAPLMQEKVEYFKQHDISVYVLNDHLTFKNNSHQKHPAKSKLSFAYWMICNLISKTVIIIDADIGIVNKAIDIKRFVLDYDVQTQKTHYVRGYPILHSSIVSFRKSSKVMHMLQCAWYDSIHNERRYPGTNKIDFGDQSSLQLAIEGNYFDITYNEFSPSVCCLDSRKCTNENLFVHYVGSRHTNNLRDVHKKFLSTM